MASGNQTMVAESCQKICLLTSELVIEEAEQGNTDALKYAHLLNLWEELTMNDEIIEELWLIKEKVAAKYAYDLEKMAKSLRERGKNSSAKVVDLQSQNKVWLQKRS